MTLVEKPPTAAPSQADRQYQNRWRILGVVGLAQLMVVLDVTVMNIALPTAQRELGFSIADRQWILTAYSLAFGGLLLVGGRLSDFIGRKQMLLVGFIGFAAASALGGAAQSFGVLVVARGIQGAFGAVLAPAALSVLTTTFSDPAERGRAFGVYGAIAGAGGAVGLLLGGLLTQYLSWRWALYINVGFAIVGIFGASTLLQSAEPATPGGLRHLDGPGTVTVVAGLVALVYGLSEAETRGWGNGLTIALIVGGLVVLGCFVLIESRTANPLLPLRIVSNRNRGASYLTVLLLGASLFGVFLFLTYYLQEIQRYSPVRSGVAFLPMVAALMLSSTTVSAILLPRVGPRPLVGIGMAMGAAGMALFTQLGLHSGYVADILPGLVLLGFGLGMVFSASINTATYGAAPSDAGVASAMVNTSQQIGGSIGVALLNTIAASAAASYLVGKAHTATTVALSSVHGDVRAFIISAVLLGAGAVLGVIVYEPGRLAVGRAAPVAAA